MVGVVGGGEREAGTEWRVREGPGWQRLAWPTPAPDQASPE